MTKRLLGAILSLALFSGTAAASTVLLDTITGPFDPNGGLVVADSPILAVQSLALPFSSTIAPTITTIEAFIASPSGIGFVNLGIMADVAGVPSGTFIDFSHASLVPGQPVVLNGLNWSLAANTHYWLAATADPGGFDFWNQGSTVSQFAMTLLGLSPWVLTNSPTPEALIDATLVAATPLPPTWTMMLIGIAGFGFVAYRRKSKPALRLA